MLSNFSFRPPSNNRLHCLFLITRTLESDRTELQETSWADLHLQRGFVAAVEPVVLSVITRERRELVSLLRT